MKRSLGFWIPGYDIEQMIKYVGLSELDAVKKKKNLLILKQMMHKTKQFNESSFIDEIVKSNQKRKGALIEAVDEEKLTLTERAFHIAFNPERKIKCDLEQVVNPHVQFKQFEVEIEP